jgi:hypothetical protein
LIARDIRLDLLYMTAKDETIGLFKDLSKAGRLKFPRSVIKEYGIDPSCMMPAKVRDDKEKLKNWKQQKHRGFLLLEHDTFVQAGVDQVYAFVTMIPEDTLCLLTWGSFQYAQSPLGWQRLVARIARKLGLIPRLVDHDR